MTVSLIQQRLESYRCQDAREEEHALREIAQELILAGLSRTDYFKFALFQGGTALRIFYGLQRFSEDLDFLLKSPDSGFDLVPFLKSACRELEAFGFDFEIMDKSRDERAVRKVFVKQEAAGILLNLKYTPRDRSTKSLRVKIECDVRPPEGSGEKIKYLTFPFACAVALQDEPSLLAGKLHAVLCRKVEKGRDWYDLLWYSGQKAAVNYDFLSSALDQSGPWQGKGMKVNAAWIRTALEDKIQRIDWEEMKKDIQPFVKSHERPSLDVWGKDFFTSCVENVFCER